MLEEELRSAAARASLNDVKALLKKGAKAEPDPSGRTPLHLAASSGHTEIVESLVVQSKHINTTDSVGRTPLQIAAAAGHVEVIEVLLNHGADVNLRDTLHGNTALHEASWHGFSKTVSVLVKHKADTDLKNCAGFAPLHLCCQNGHNQSCRELLLAGANPNIQNNYGDTPLHTSARYGHAGVARILISATCHVSDQNKNGDTALHIAAAMGRRKLTSILLEAGCNQTVRNKQYETACDIATRKDLNEIIIILQSVKPSKSGKHHKKKSKKASDTSDSDKRSKEHIPSKDDKKNMENVKWSPYGCHYYPDPNSFPQPKLDSLPGEPLNKGEQYYLDLAGNIRKGPVGVGLTCYCTNFLRDMEARLEKSNIELKHKIKMTRCRLEERVERTEGLLAEYLGEEKIKRHSSTEGGRGRTPELEAGGRKRKTRSHSLDLLQNCTHLRQSTPEPSSVGHSQTPELPPIDLSLLDEEDLRKLNALSLKEANVEEKEVEEPWEGAKEPYSEIHKLPYRTRTAVYSPTYDSIPTEEGLDPTCSPYVPDHLSDKVSNSNVFDGHNVTI